MKYLHTLLTLTLAFLFFSCEKESVVLTPADTIPDVQLQLDNLGAPDILFQYAVTELETGEERGWLIDRAGNVRSYQRTANTGLTPSGENELWTAGELSALRDLAAETIATVEPVDLLLRVRQAMTLSEPSLSAAAIEENAVRQTAFYAFTRAENEAGDGCYGHNSDDRPRGTDEKLVSRRVVHLSGYMNQAETSGNGAALYAWLAALNEGL